MAARNSTYIEDEEDDEEEEVPEIYERNAHNSRPVYGSIIRDDRRISADAVYASTSREIYPKHKYYSTESSSYGNFTNSLTMTSVSEESIMDDEELLYRFYEKLPLKDFSQEIRAHRDVDNFLCNTLLLLDIEESNMEDIVQLMIDKVLEIQKKKNLNMADLMKTIFAMQRVDLITKTIQGVKYSQMNTLQYDHTWLCMLCEWPTVMKRHTVIVRLLHPVNMGSTSQEVIFVILVVASNKEKSTKSVVETARTFCTLFADMDCRYRLLEAKTDQDFREILKEETRMLFSKFARTSKATTSTRMSIVKTEPETEKMKYTFCRGIQDDFKRRLSCYMSDYKDGLNGRKALWKVVPSTIYLYFACILPNVAYGMIISSDTHGAIDIHHVLLGQFLAGIIFSLVGGQSMNILLTTAPLTLFTRVVSNICDDFDINFLAMFACVGIWSSIFLISYAIFDFCNLLKWSTRSTEDIFYTFVSLIFVTDAMREMYKNFKQYYFPCQADMKAVNHWNTSQLLNAAAGQLHYSTIPQNKPNIVLTDQQCQQETSMLFLFLMTTTLWLISTISNFTKTPYLSASKRQLLADYAIPLTILIMTITSTLFSDIYMESLTAPLNVTLGPAPLHKLSAGAVVTAFFLGFSLSIVVFINHTMSSAQLNKATYKLKKGTAYHWDLLIIAIINLMLSIIGCPWMHAALPVSSQHVKTMAQMEDRVEQGSVYQIIVQVRETRVTGLLCYMMLGLSLLLLPHPLADIPRPVLCGFFLHIAITYLSDRQLIDRFLLLITEQSSYPPSHYIRRVPQREIHKYTFLQIAQLFFLCIIGLAPVPYIQMFFPMIVISLVYIRHKLIPKVVEKKHLAVLD